MERSPSKKIIYLSRGHEIPRILSNPKFISAVTRARHLSPSGARYVVPKDPPKTFALPIVLSDVIICTLRSCPNFKLEEHPYSFVHNCLPSIIAATLYLEMVYPFRILL